jgi:hypothetical protein
VLHREWDTAHPIGWRGARGEGGARGGAIASVPRRAGRTSCGGCAVGAIVSVPRRAGRTSWWEGCGGSSPSAAVSVSDGPCLDEDDSGAVHLATLATSSCSWHRSRARSRPCARPTGLHKRVRPKQATGECHHPWSCEGASSGGGHCVAKGPGARIKGAHLKGPQPRPTEGPRRSRSLGEGRYLQS